MLVRENLSDKLAQILGEKIMHQDLQPGAPIIETQIAKEWGVSRSPVRDALRILEQNHLVERMPKGSYCVTSFSPESIRHYYDTIDILFSYAFARAAQNADDQTLADLEAALEKMEKSIEGVDIKLYLTGVLEFAQAILTASGNPIVRQMAMVMMPNAERIQWAALSHMPEKMGTVVNLVKASYQNIVDKKPDEAAKNFSVFAKEHVNAAIASIKANELSEQPS